MQVTSRLELRPPTAHDDEVSQLHSIYSDAATWAHLPAGRFTEVDQTRRLLEAWRRCWSEDGLGPWLVRRRGEERVLGNAGVALRHGTSWNLGYRFAPAAQGHGYAAEACRPALQRARQARPDVPVVASLLAHNTRSAALAERLGLILVHRGPDSGNPDAVRLVYADRALDAATRRSVVS